MALKVAQWNLARQVTGACYDVISVGRGPESHAPHMTVAAGEVAEWFKAPVLKTGVRETVPGVRIPPRPLHKSLTWVAHPERKWSSPPPGSTPFQGMPRSVSTTLL